MRYGIRLEDSLVAGMWHDCNANAGVFQLLKQLSHLLLGLEFGKVAEEG